jgi:uncharacterized repeat protein (TIGR04138 family)
VKKSLTTILDEICEQDQRYHVDAYEFVLEALSFTQKKFKRERHASGSELLEGIKIVLLDKFGPLTLTVLRYCGISSTEDFGNIVFNLVSKNVLTKTEDDNIENFRNVYDFDKVFNKGYRENLARKIGRLR